MAYVNNTGFPSVTELIKPYIDTEWFTEEARGRGSAVHAACAANLLGLFVVQLPDEWIGYYNSFIKWFDVVRPKPMVVEKRFSDARLGFCGQLDLVFVDGQQCVLVDLKTSQQKQGWWELQYAAYKHLFDLNYLEKIHRGGCLRLKPDGSMPIFDEMPRDTSQAFNVFTGLLNAHKFFNAA